MSLRRQPGLVLATFVVVVVVAAGLSAPAVAPQDPAEQSMIDRLAPPFFIEGGTREHWLGTDHLGRDVLSRLIYGARVALIVGVTTVLVSGVVGLGAGLVAGYFGGVTDNLFMRLLDIQLSMPFMLLALTIIGILGPSLQNIVVVLALTGWVVYARVVRAEVLSLRTREFVAACRSLGGSDARIIFWHLLANVPRLEQYMDRLGLAAVVLRSGNNFTYLAGIAYPGTLARHLDLANSVRGVLLLWPRRGEPVVVLDYAAEGLTRDRSWVQRMEVYEPYVETAYGRVGKVLRDLGLDRERVGFERDAMTVAHWEEIERGLPALEMVDCAPMMEEVRWIKTSAEIALFKRGADLLDHVYLEVFPTIKAGETEREVHSRMVAACIRRGCGWVHGILNASTNRVIYAGEGDTRFRRGDIVRTDYVAYLDGYPGHQSRMAVLGPPSDEQRRQYAITRDIHRLAIDRCRPGVLASDIYEAVVSAYAKHGVTYTASLVGHSVGAWFHQQEPILARSRTVPLEEGMVLALEPYREHWHIQDLVVVRANGPELLSDTFPIEEMFTIA